MGCEWSSYLCPGGTKEEDTPLVKQHAPVVTFSTQYHLGEKLGEGAFSIVRKATHIATGKVYAAKCLNLKHISAQEMQNIEREVCILKQLQHPNVISCKAYFLEVHAGYIVTDLMEGGDLFDRIVEKSVYTEKEAKDVMHAIVDAVAYCHAKHIVHRDLKPENILLSSHEDDALIKIADFGLAKDDEYLSTMCGSPAYVAPEVLSGDKGLYDKEVDIWSIGVITYALLCGYLPFYDDNPSVMFKKIKRGAFEFDAPHWDHVSVQAKSFVKMMLVVDPKQRYVVALDDDDQHDVPSASADDLLKHPWIQTANDATVPLSGAISGLRQLTKRHSLKSAAKAVQSTLHMKKLMSAH
ncbi:Aste57867_9179 [Aphanomyces stellatus]|uniref:Aste57867_9179 protein n=1 Tax=Aphanomyces stellatus TaxID=120398 RepID=A0A485KMK1_9STRA|nr:hypothetical protein As57867_009143 [Aphanomyces stellatus]VFT86063.1 Aste57867_9179 [Aphanomyces stellatus]